MPSLPSFSLLFLLPLLFYVPSLTTSRPAPVAELDQAALPPRHPNVTTRQAFERLLDAERGSHLAGLADLKRYFARFGYLSGPVHVPNDDNYFDDRFESAVESYQTRLGLPVTRRLDSATLNQIMAPRCGVPDSASPRRGQEAGSVERFAFFPGRPRWVRRGPLALTYAISPRDTVDYLTPAEVAAVVRRAFDRWARVIPVRFTEAAEFEAADVKVGFFGGDHGDGEPFDGVLGILAHAFSPESGRLHLDSAERWAVDLRREKAACAVDLESVATHEIGHVLGLAHSPVREAVMYPSLSPRTRKVELTVDDVEGVQALYGSNPDFSFSSLAASDTSAAPATARDRVLFCRSWVHRSWLRLVVVVAVGRLFV